MIGRWVGLIGGVLCVAMPHVVAHGKVVGLEAPSGLFYLLAVWLLFRGLRREGNSFYHVAAGLCAGLAVSTRLVNGGVLFVMLAVYVIYHRKVIVRERTLPMPITMALLPFVAVATFFLIWPYMWEKPVLHIAEMLSHWKPDKHLEFFLGERQKGPLYYYPLYFSVTMPVVALGALVLSWTRLAVRRSFGGLCVLVWMLGPFLVALSPLSRDGVRYLYPALIPACLLSAAGVDWVARGVARLAKRAVLRVPVSAALGAGVAVYLLSCGLSVHPYYLDYYNELTGRPRGGGQAPAVRVRLVG